MHVRVPVRLRMGVRVFMCVCVLLFEMDYIVEKRLSYHNAYWRPL